MNTRCKMYSLIITGLCLSIARRRPPKLYLNLHLGISKTLQLPLSIDNTLNKLIEGYSYIMKTHLFCITVNKTMITTQNNYVYDLRLTVANL